jgi:FSR family fosmidomycin resistance protein-like MFS transporter
MSARPRAVLFVLVGAHVVNDLCSTVLPAFLPAVAEEFDLDYTELGILLFAFILLPGVLQPVMGHMADRLGRRRWMLVFGFVVGALGFFSRWRSLPRSGSSWQ